MQNVHPIIAQALNPFAPPKDPYIFAVSINMGGDLREVSILAPSSCSAISRAIELLMTDDDECQADGLTITAKVQK